MTSEENVIENVNVWEQFSTIGHPVVRLRTGFSLIQGADPGSQSLSEKTQLLKQTVNY